MKSIKYSLFAGLILILSYFVFFSDLPAKPIQAATQTINKILSQGGPLSGKSSPQLETQNDSVTSQTDLIELKNWIAAEASSMDSKSFDPLISEAQMIDRAQNLNLQQIEFLKELALNVEPSSVANERILSVYLLTKSQNLALDALKEIANQPLSKPGPHEVHSLDETLSMHEKAIRRMVIDDFFRRAGSDPSLKEALYRMIQGIQVPELKSYALSKYQEMFGN
jgi:hypothetical protein